MLAPDPESNAEDFSLSDLTPEEACDIGMAEGMLQPGDSAVVVAGSSITVEFVDDFPDDDDDDVDDAPGPSKAD